MGDWLRWVQLAIVVALPSAIWAFSTGHDAIGTMCWALLMILIPINLGISAFRNWKKWQKKSMSVDASEVLPSDNDGNSSALRD